MNEYFKFLYADLELMYLDVFYSHCSIVDLETPMRRVKVC